MGATDSIPDIIGHPMAITDWPTDERPREKLLARGAGALTDAELLALFLRTGSRGKSAVELGREIMARFGSFSVGIADFDISVVIFYVGQNISVNCRHNVRTFM